MSTTTNATGAANAPAASTNEEEVVILTPNELMEKVKKHREENQKKYQEGQKRMEEFLVRGMVQDEDPVCHFFAKILKQPQFLQGALACVVSTDIGIKLFIEIG